MMPYIMIRVLKRPLFLILVIFILTVAGFAARKVLFNDTLPADKNQFEMLQWERPKGDLEWAEDVKRESLNFRFDYQLAEMLSSHIFKRDQMAEELQKYADCPECVKYEIRNGLKEKFKNPELEQKINEMFNEQLFQKRQDYQTITRSVERIEKEIDLRERGIVDRKSDLLKITPSMDREREELKKLKSETN